MTFPTLYVKTRGGKKRGRSDNELLRVKGDNDSDHLVLLWKAHAR